MLHDDMSNHTSEWEREVLCGVMVVFVPLTALGNSVMFIAIRRTPKLNTASNLLLLNLAVLNLLVGSTTMVTTVITVAVDKWLLGTHWCSFSAFLDNVLLIGSLCTLAACSVDRRTLTMDPIKKKHINRTTMKRVIGLIWLFGIVVSVPPLFGWGTYEYSHSSYSCGISINEDSSEKYYVLLFFLLSFPIQIITIVICYTHISMSLALRKNSVWMKKSMMMSHQQRSTTVMIGFIISLLVITTLPIFVAGMLAWASGLDILSEKAHIAVHWTFIMRSGLDPLVFGLFHQTFRQAMLDVIRCKSQRDIAIIERERRLTIEHDVKRQGSARSKTDRLSKAISMISTQEREVQGLASESQ